MKKILIILLLFVLVSCNRANNMPSDAILERYGITNFLASNGLNIDQIKDMLDEYGIENDYPTSDSSGLVVYFAKSETTGKYYELYTPVQYKYDVLVIEVTVPEFATIEEKVGEYNNINGNEIIDLCDNYCDVFFSTWFVGDKQENKDFLNELESPIILKVGTLSSGSPGVGLGRYGQNQFVIFYYEISKDEIVILLEFSI